jgi:hypothetical protein
MLDAGTIMSDGILEFWSIGIGNSKILDAGFWMLDTGTMRSDGILELKD